MNDDLLVQVAGVSKSFARGGVSSARRPAVRAVRNVSFDIVRREVVGVVGESGSGKSTLGRLVVGLLDPDEGSITIDGTTRLAELHGRRRREARRVVQIVFQDSYRSLDPTMTVAKIVEEPLVVAKALPPADRRTRVEELIDRVRLTGDILTRRPAQLSGGQRQRVAIARSLAATSQLIVLDESIASLDRATQAHVLDLLIDLQHDLGISYLFISHDLAAVRYISDRVLVMYLGEIVECGPADAIANDPLHPYAMALRSAVPVADPTARRERIVLTGDPPDPSRPPPGCCFATRCPAVHEPCHTVRPALRAQSPGHSVACHLYGRDVEPLSFEPSEGTAG